MEAGGASKKNVGGSSSAVSTRSRPQPASALLGRRDPATPCPAATPDVGVPAPASEMQPQDAVSEEQQIRKHARPKKMASKRKPPTANAPGPSSASQEGEPKRRRRQGRDDAEPASSQGAPTSSTQDTATEAAEVSEEEAQSKVYKKVNNRWVDNPRTVAFDRSTVPERLFAELDYKKDLKNTEAVEARRRLKAEVAATKKFKEMSAYMYIFGRGNYFELDLDDMTDAGDDAGIIVRPLEGHGILYVLEKMTKLNYSK